MRGGASQLAFEQRVRASGEFVLLLGVDAERKCSAADVGSEDCVVRDRQPAFVSGDRAMTGRGWR